MSILELVTRYKTEKIKMLPTMNKNNVVYTVVYAVKCCSAIKCTDISGDMNEFGKIPSTERQSLDALLVKSIR